MRGVIVVLRQALSHLARGNADDRISIGVVGGSSPEDFHRDTAFLEFGSVPEKGLFHGVRKQSRVPLAVCKKGVDQQALQLFTDPRRVGKGTRVYGLLGSSGRHGHAVKTSG